jgi:hypothetical protein
MARIRRLSGRLTARGRKYMREGSLLAVEQMYWDAGLIRDTKGRVFRMSDVNDAWKREMVQYDNLPRELRDQIKYMVVKDGQ